MKILSFVEGATSSKGGLGLVGVPMIMSTLAAKGHNVVLVVGGPPNPGRENYVVRTVEEALTRKEGAGTFAMVTARVWTTWAFNPLILWKFRKIARDADCISLHSLYSFPVLAGYLFARLYRKPYAVWPHGVLAPFQRQVSRRIKWLYGTIIGRRVLDDASVIFYSAEGERQEAEPLGLRPPSVVVPHGMNAAEFDTLPARGRFRERYLSGHSGGLVLFLARLNEKKGLDLLVDALAGVVGRLPDTKLAIVGPPDPPAFRRRVLDWISERDIASNVAVTGPVSNSQKLEALADADVFVLPSQAENFGFSIFEAMASGVPVVVSDSLNYAAEIANNGAGLAVPRAPGEFADAIIRLLEDRPLRDEMAANAAKMARSFTWEETGSVSEEVFELILKRRPLPSRLTESRHAHRYTEQESKTGFKMTTFAEGATIRKGGIGLAGIPMILGGTALSGNRIVTIMGGPPIPGRNDFFVPSIDDAVRRKQGSGTFGIVAYKAWTTWAFSPTMIRKIGNLVKASDFVGLHSLYSFPVLIGYLYARYYKKPFGIWLHGVLAPFQRRVSARKKWLYNRLVARKILGDASVIFFTARGEREEVSELRLKAPSVVVPHGFVADEFANLPSRGDFRAKFLNGHAGPLVVFLGRLNAKKGIDLLVQAMVLLVRQNAATHLAIAGPPDPPSFERQVRNWIATSHMDANITLTGTAGPDERLQLLADADVFVMPSHAENFGFGVFEAMASRVPVVVSNSLNYANEIAACEAGFSVERTPEALAQAITRLLEDRELRRRMGSNGVRMARRYSWEKTGANIERVVQSILQHQPLPADLTA